MLPLVLCYGNLVSEGIKDDGSDTSRSRIEYEKIATQRSSFMFKKSSIGRRFSIVPSMGRISTLQIVSLSSSASLRSSSLLSRFAIPRAEHPELFKWL